MDNPLQGCINDMKAMSNLLRSFSNGFACTTKQNQTKSGMLSAIRSVFAGAAEKDGKLLTSGGRVLGVTAIADTLQGAIDSSYKMVEQIHFDNAFYRHDIGQRALNAKG